MKTAVLTLLLALPFCGVAADEYQYLVFTTAEGDVAMTAMGTHITFADGNLIAVNGDETQTIALSSLTKFCFSNETTGIAALPAVQGTETVEVYNAAGQSLGSCILSVGASLPLAKGIYIVKGESGTKKMIVK